MPLTYLVNIPDNQDEILGLQGIEGFYFLWLLVVDLDFCHKLLAK